VTANSHANDRIEEFESTTYRQKNGIFRNVNGRFEDVSAAAGPDFAVARAHRGIGIGDFDGDGRLDLVMTVLGDRAQLLRNVSSPDNHWITLRLQGQKSARDGIGARVKLGTQSDAMTTAVGYASSSDFGVHFGLGTAAAIGTIEVKWPSGLTQTLDQPRPNQVLSVAEQTK
jgi:enediyne biosynthesis protein E4